MSHHIGRIGEDIAASYLTNKNYVILARNYFVRYGEIDIIALNKGKLVFVEVKTRAGTHYGKPYEAVSKRKVEKIYRAGCMFASYKLMHFPMQIDIISIQLGSDNQLKSLFHMRNIEV